MMRLCGLNASRILDKWLVLIAHCFFKFNMHRGLDRIPSRDKYGDLVVLVVLFPFASLALGFLDFY